MDFPCIVCGLCCENAKFVPALQSLINSSGQCRYYDDRTKKCKIYIHRPEICNISAMYRKYYASAMTEEEFYLKNLQVCKGLNLAAGREENANQIAHFIEQLKGNQ